MRVKEAREIIEHVKKIGKNTKSHRNPGMTIAEEIEMMERPLEGKDPEQEIESYGTVLSFERMKKAYYLE